MKAYKPTLPIFGERDVKRVSFGPEYSTSQQYDSLYDPSMTEYLNRPKIKKRLFQLGLTGANGNAATNTEQEKTAQKIKQLLKEREDVLRKLRARESTRIARIARNKVTRPCATCEAHDRIVTYLKTHSCPVHSNITYQTAVDSVKLMAGKEVNLAKLEVENKKLKNLWNSEVLRMEEEALEQRLKQEKKHKQQVDMELDKLRQQKEAMKMVNLEQIKINLYAKIRRRLGLQALLTTLRDAEDGVTTTLFGKSGEEEVASQQSNNEFEYLPPPPSLTQLVRPVSAPPSSPNLSEISLDQSLHDQIRKRPSSSRGYRSPRGPYTRSAPGGVKQAIVSPLVRSVSNKTMSSRIDPSTDTEEDLDDDTLPLEEADTVIASGLSSTEVVTPLSSMATLQGPSTSSRVQSQRQPESLLSSSRRPSSSEKKVNFSLTPEPPELPEMTQPAEPKPQVNTMVSNIIQMAKNQYEADLLPDQAVAEPDEGTSPKEAITNEDVTDSEDDQPSPLTTTEPDDVGQGTIGDVIPQSSSIIVDEVIEESVIETSQLVTKRSSKPTVTKKGSKLDAQKSTGSKNKSVLSLTKKPTPKPANTKQASGNKSKVQPSKKKLDPQWKQAILKNVKK